MIWILEVFAVLQGGLSFLGHNQAHSQSISIFQFVLFGALMSGLLWIAAREAGSARLRKQLVPVELAVEPGVRTVLEQARRLARFHGAVACHWAADSTQLAIVGYLRPWLLLGRTVAETLTPEELEAALAHELNHVRRRDALRADAVRVAVVILLMSIVFAIAVFLAVHAAALESDWTIALAISVAAALVGLSVAKVIARRVERQAEIICDEAAASGAGGPLAVASAMLKTAQLRRSRPIGNVAACPLFSADTFEIRVRKLLRKAAGQERTQSRWRGRGAPGFAFAVAVVAMFGTVDLGQAAAMGCKNCALVVQKSDWTGPGTGTCPPADPAVFMRHAVTDRE